MRRARADRRRNHERAYDRDGVCTGASSGETDLFIRPGYQFHAVDAMVTNFHLPQSSLLMLVCAFAGIELRDGCLPACRRAALSILLVWRLHVDP